MSQTVSVVIPTHDRPARVLKALRSVYEQTRPPQEIVLVNDASTKDYGKVLVSLQAARRQKPGISLRYVESSEPLGAAESRNRGFQESCGEIVMFLDDDDSWEADKIARQLAVFESDPSVGLVYSGRRVVRTDGHELYTIVPEASGDLSRLILLRNWIGITSSAALRRDVFRAAGGFDPVMPARQDYDLWIRVAQLTLIGFDPAPTVRYTIHEVPENQISGRPNRYRKAVAHLREKYSNLYDSLSWLDRRRARARLQSTLAAKVSRNSYVSALPYAFRSLGYYPTLKALSCLVPYRVQLALRQLRSR